MCDISLLQLTVSLGSLLSEKKRFKGNFKMA